MSMKPARLLFVKTNELAIEFLGPKSIPEAFEPKGSRRRYPHLRISSSGPYSLDPETEDAYPLFFENTPYHVVVKSGKPDKRLSVHHRDPLIAHAFKPSLADADVTTGMFSFKNQVGRSTFTFLINDRPHVTMEIEVFPTKLDYEDDYWNLIADVSRHVYNLAFEYLRATYRHAAPVPQISRPSDLEWLLLLETIMQDLERAVYQIARQPRRAMVREPADCLTARIKRPDGHVRAAMRRARGRKMPVPARLTATRAQPSLDTAENRVIRQELVSIRRRLADLHGRAQKLTARHGQKRYRVAAARIRSLENKVSRFLRFEPFTAATGPPPATHSALVFRSAPGYREAFRSCLLLRLGLKFQADALQVPMKDMAELYEYWCLLTILETISVGTGGAFNPQTLVEAGPGGLSLRLRKGRHLALQVRRGARTICTVRYNPGIPSATGEQRPDILLSFHPKGWETPVEVVLDAKYRLVADSKYLSKYGTPGPPEEAINQLYRYRDAIVDNDDPPRRRIVEALALFPYKDSIGQRFSDNRLYLSREKVGIGALPFLPSETVYVEDWVRETVRRSGSHFAERTVGVRVRDEELTNRAKMAEAALIGVIGHGKTQWDWIQTRRLYLAPLSKIGRHRRLDIRWLGFFEPAAMTKKKYGAVRYVSRVSRLEVVPRRAIKTPWASRRSPGEPYLLFHIEKPHRLPRPIRNTDGHRVTFRWGTRYSLDHALTMSELYLETEAERRLWEELKHAGIPFTTRAGRVAAIDPGDPAGRTVFILDRDQRVRYQGSGEFAVFNRKGAKTHSFTLGELRTRGISGLL